MLNKNFCIIAHIDHGKSTLSDRIIELCGNVSKNKQMPQMLDSMPLERERGITIKLNFVCLKYKDFQLNLIDTPGHADFAYEVSRSLAAAEGAILLVDATQGIQAQTISNYLLAKKNNLKIIPVINKIDMPNAKNQEIEQQMMEKFQFQSHEIMRISAKTGLGCKELLDKLISDVPTALQESNKPLKALIFDVFYDKYKGAIIFIRIFEGKLKISDEVLFLQTKKKVSIIGLAIKVPEFKDVDSLSAGDVGCFYANIKNIKEIKIGDTVTLFSNPTSESLPGFENVLPMVFSSFYPKNLEDRDVFKSSLEKLSLSDSSFVFNYETSNTLGFGVRCGFLGLLHLEIIKERLEREFNVIVNTSTPSVKYEIVLTNKEIIYLTTPADLPEITKVAEMREPYLLLELIITEQYIGACMELFEKYRSKYIDLLYISNDQVILKYEMPLSEIIKDFYDNLKSSTNGYGSINYQFIGYQKADLVKVDILLNGDIFPQLSFIECKTGAYTRAQKLVKKLKEFIPSHLFEIPVQAAINKKIIARETIKAQKKNVTAKCYGGDITRKKKLWEAQKRGKKKMQMIGKVQITNQVFEKILKN